MEIKAYIKILFKRWWALMLGFSVVVLATWIWTVRQQPIYQSQATFVIRPHTSGLAVEDDFVKALDIVSRRVEINTTFGEVATSKLIKSKAIEALEIPPREIQDFSVSAGVVGGTNILTISVEGPNPAITQEFCTMVGDETLKYVKGLYDVFELQPLDAASLPKKPVRPNLFLNLVIGSVLGMGLGVGLALLIEFIRSPYVEPDAFNIIDGETGAYNKSYFTLRLWQEMNRSKRNKYPLSLGLVKVEFDGENVSHREWIEAVRVFKKLTNVTMREGDILARIDGDTFAVLCPHMPNNKAKAFVSGIKESFASIAMDVLSINGDGQIKSYSSVVTYQGGLISEAGFLEKGILALEASHANLASEA
jgi:capsular polysaccharide biosynthesis protein/GGDEF domain-containing protein